MAVSKRLRFEIFRRDNHACRYCGGHAPDVDLTVDHVVPTALGGSDKPENLVAACRDCNAGKSASSPDATVVSDVEQDAIRWARAMKQAAEKQSDDLEAQKARANLVYNCWATWGVGDGPDRVTFVGDLPSDWARTVEMWHRASVTADEIIHAIRVAMTKPGLATRDLWKYTCGVVWRQLDERQKLAREILDAEGDPTPQIVYEPPSLAQNVVDVPDRGRWLELVEEHPELVSIEGFGLELLAAVRDEFPDADLVEAWYGYPRIVEHFGVPGVKHRLLAFTSEHDFSDADESVCYQALIAILRWAWSRVTV